MIMKLSKIKSLAFLGYHFFWHFIKKIFNLSPRGLKDFLAAYKNDRIFAISSDERNNLPGFSHCIVCRLCDLACPDLTNGIAMPLQRMAPSFLVAGFSRSLTDFIYFKATTSCGDCQACEEACPQDVPIKKIFEFMNGHT